MKQYLLHYSKRIFQHELISGSTYMFVGSMVGNICAFLFNLLVARKLTAVDYGIYASLLSLFSLTVLLPQSFLGSIVQFSTKYFSTGEHAKAKKLYRKVMGFIAIAGFIIFFALLVFSPFISSFLHITNTWYIAAVGFIILFSFFSTVNISYLQSLLAFGFMSFIQALGAITKLLGGMLFIFIGFGIFGAIGAVLLSFLVPFGLSFLRLKFLLTKQTDEEIDIPVGEIFRYAIPATLTALALSSFISSDIILAKHFLPPFQAGLYAGLSLVGKVIFYFTGIIPSVMFPILIRQFSKGHKVHNTFYLGLLLVSVPSICITVFYFLFPSFVLHLFLGRLQYLAGASELGFMALFLSLYSIITVMVNFFLSLKQTKIVFPVFAMALLQIVFICLFHDSIMQIITVSMATTSVLVVLLGLYYLYHHTIARSYVPRENALQEI